MVAVFDDLRDLLSSGRFQHQFRVATEFLRPISVERLEIILIFNHLILVRHNGLESLQVVSLNQVEILISL